MSKRFVPPKLDMGPAFATAGNIKAKHKSQVSSGVSTPGGGGKRGKYSKRSDTIPVTITNLALYFDWRRGQFAQSPTLFKIASTIWLYLEYTKLEEYSINFASATENTVLPYGTYHSPPVLVTTSPKGEILIMVQNMKKLPEYSEKQFLLILYPELTNVRFFDDCQVKTSSGTHCTYWEVEGVEHLTHIAMDKHGVIYFTTGESVFRIVKTEGDMYLDTFEDIFSPSNDTSHITCLWRQGNDIFLTIQDWDTEENLDVYKVKPNTTNKGMATPDSPLSGKGVRSPSFDRSNSTKRRTRTRSGSGYGSDCSAGTPRGRGTANDSNDFVTKVRTFSLSYNSRIWQLGSMNFQKKFVLAVAAAQKAYAPQLLKIGFKQKIKVLGLTGKGKGDKRIVWPKTTPEDVPHAIFNHKATKSWFCVLPATHTKKGGLYWIQFKFDKPKKKISWQRLVSIPEEAQDGDWLYYDELRDVLVGFRRVDDDNKEYVFKYLPDMTKYLWIATTDDDDEKASDPIMQRPFRRRKSKDNTKVSSLEKRRSASGRPNTPKLRNKTSEEPLIKPSKAKKRGSGVDVFEEKEKEKTKRTKKNRTRGASPRPKGRPSSPRPKKPTPKKPTSPRPKRPTKPTSPRPKKTTSPRQKRSTTSPNVGRTKGALKKGEQKKFTIAAKGKEKEKEKGKKDKTIENGTEKEKTKTPEKEKEKEKTKTRKKDKGKSDTQSPGSPRKGASSPRKYVPTSPRKSY
eukprot:95298_1